MDKNFVQTKKKPFTSMNAKDWQWFYCRQETCEGLKKLNQSNSTMRTMVHVVSCIAANICPKHVFKCWLLENMQYLLSKFVGRIKAVRKTRHFSPFSFLIIFNKPSRIFITVPQAHMCIYEYFSCRSASSFSGPDQLLFVFVFAFNMYWKGEV